MPITQDIVVVFGKVGELFSVEFRLDELWLVSAAEISIALTERDRKLRYVNRVIILALKLKLPID